MPILADYQQFEGLHWETGTVRNYHDYRGVLAPHTGKPISEALLMGVSGGAVMGYFSFAYKGYDPHVVILTRNTFDPLDRLLQRLGIVQNVVQTASARKAESNLLDTLEAGVPAIVWADELTGALDSENSTEIMDLVVRMNAEKDQTFIIVTHDRNIARRAHRLIRMRDGLIEQDGANNL